MPLKRPRGLVLSRNLRFDQGSVERQKKRLVVTITEQKFKASIHFDAEQLRWVDPRIRYRRLLALVETDEEGIALVDLSRIQGGDDHWRLCRGLEGRFVQQGVEPQSQPGTLAGADFERGADGLRHGDHAGLAWMNEVAQIDAGGARGQWTSRHDEAARLDLHQLHVSEGTRLRTARSTAVMDSPDRSRYDYHTLAWQRAAQGTTCIDLVFEPHLGDPTLADAQTISSAGADEAAGVHLTTHAGRELSIYWSPDREPDEETRFEDDTSMQGPLALVETERALERCRLVGMPGFECGANAYFPQTWRLPEHATRDSNAQPHAHHC